MDKREANEWARFDAEMDLMPFDHMTEIERERGLARLARLMPPKP